MCVCRSLFPQVRVSISQQASVDFVHKIREGGEDGLDAFAHHVGVDGYGLKGGGAVKDVGVVDLCDGGCVVRCHVSYVVHCAGVVAFNNVQPLLYGQYLGALS